MNGTSYKLVVFDLDGVLIDSLKVMEAAYYSSYERVVGKGSPPDFETYKKYLGRSFPEILKSLNLPLEMHDVFKEESNNRIDLIDVFDHVPGMLKSLAEEGINLTIATGKDGSRARRILQHHNIFSYFSLVIGSDEVERPKPAPDMIIRSMDYCNIASPEDVLMVGDATADLESGRAAGVDVAAALWGKGGIKNLMSYRPEYVLNDPMELTYLQSGIVDNREAV